MVQRLAAAALGCVLLAATAARADDLVVADKDAADGTGAVYRLAPDGTTSVLAAGAPLVDPEGVLVSSTCDVFITDATQGKLYRTDISGGPLKLLAAGPPMVHPVGMTFDTDGTLLVADEEANAGTGALIRVDPATGAQSTVSSGGLFLTPLGVSLIGSTIYVADADSFGNAGGIIKVGRDGSQTAFSMDPASNDQPQGLTTGADGKLLLTDLGRQQLFRVGDDGTQTTLTAAPLNSPRQVAIERSGTIVLVDEETKQVYGIDPTTGVATQRPLDRALVVPFGMAVIPPCTPVAQPSGPAAPSTPSAPKPATTLRLTAATAGHALAATLHGRGLGVRVACTTACQVRIRVHAASARGKTLATRTLALTAGQARTAHLRVSGRARLPARIAVVTSTTGAPTVVSSLQVRRTRAAG